MRAELDAFHPDFVLIWGDDQYENFKEDIIPPFCILAYDQMDCKPFTKQYRLHAAENALHRCAHQEAVIHLTKGLDVLRRVSPTPERVQQELRLQTKLGEVLMATKGYAAPDVGQTYARAYELCQQVGGTPQQRFPVLMGLLGFHHLRAELRTAQVLGAQCVQLAETVQHPTLLIQAYFGFGMALLWLGELLPARA